MSRPFALRTAFVLVGCAFVASAAHATIRTVTATSDTGAGSLRSAIAAATAGDVIQFAIPGAGVQTISITSGALPPVAAGVTINGLSQGTASCAAWPPTLLVEIEGGSAPPGTAGLTINGNDTVVRGLIINSFSGDGIQVNGASNLHVECNFIGADATGTMDYGNAGNGVALVGSSNVTIGGADTSQRNLISANALSGISIDTTSSGATVAANYIGTDVTGAAALGNFNGLVVHAGNALIGSGNLISGNVENAILADAPTTTQMTVIGNQIGSNAADSAALPNGGAGVYLQNGAHDNTIGTVQQGNLFRANGGTGVFVFGDTTLNNSIRGNSMLQNASIGIDLGDFFENPNDPGDPDVGPNRLQNTPVPSDVTYDPTFHRVTATFTVPTDPANATYPLLIDFYVADVDDEEGQTYLGTLTYDATNFATGTITRSFYTSPGLVAQGQDVVASATDSAGNTSEFSAIAITVPEPIAGMGGVAAIAALAAAAQRARISRQRATR